MINQTNPKGFITDNFLLRSKEAEILFHDYAKKMPIVDYHNHLSAKQIAKNKPIENITKAWLNEDHYKWRGMRAHGVDEAFITGSVSLKDKFTKWAATVPYTLRNPLFHWTQLELKRYFNIDTILQPDTADAIYDKANAVLALKTPAELLEQMKVEVVCTTDDPTDSLEYHKQIKEGHFYTRVLPTFRSDALFFIENTYEFTNYLDKLATCVHYSIDSLDNLLKAIDARIDFFHEHGCKLSDYGVTGPLYVVDYTEGEVAEIFEKFLSNRSLTENDVAKYRTYVLFYLSRRYHEKGWVQQFHLGTIRNNNKRLVALCGADAGCDSIGDFSFAESMSRFFGKLDYENKLAKTICYNLNPAHNEVFASMMGNFNTGELPGKMQWGSGWWYLDQKDGIEKQLNALSNIGLLSHFVGMLTDSRSFLSFPRHEYFRRILCDLIADDVQKGLIPNDMAFLGKMVQDICYNNAISYFKFDTN
ncbi:glucuronate isomerase [Flavivirga spongiicola]|uniref:Uronate isomerase n=1 Tax=Flavivirga spongiicola TaxID=421621 RepID=A0ABU7XLV5_9FLAO|nr:glucuronate isomerase [Flavivirga sp. MEBiC05379]MDO5981406.1 glucuronate isomerase [Flavivirga sp. MEBiC05379]